MRYTVAEDPSVTDTLEFKLFSDEDHEPAIAVRPVGSRDWITIGYFSSNSRSFELYYLDEAQRAVLSQFFKFNGNMVHCQ